ncbi:AEC family transporter [Undibacterium sp. LX40W]|uniref:AEC family transporter n=1 Tax=Undibacterium nitidum TaxID=2762298 RepID=A0A923KVI5_9BURK|nr:MULTISPECIES: AEC family transporter [Undibacterium]MBC3883187.1 AEC family transporter [Undibacterium nitidum]MBC3893469.1 AEC family transporter [Undibacterium sp. LX40W]
MSLAIFLKLFVLILIVAIGWWAGRTSMLRGPEPVRVISAVAFYLLAPALLFRATARIDAQHMPWQTLTAFFIPVMIWLLLNYVLQRFLQKKTKGVEISSEEVAKPAVRALSLSFGNNVQVGLPLIASLYGDMGLSIHVAIISMHALLLMGTGTLLVELDIARQHLNNGQQSLAKTLQQTARNIIIHPIILPVLLGFAFNLTGLTLPQPLDETLQLMGSGTVPLCLLLIGLSLAHHGIKGSVKPAMLISIGKMCLMPLAVFLTARFGLHLSGVQLAVVTLGAALPCGSNTLLFAQRYQTLEAETSAAIVMSTVGFALMAPLWLMVLGN